MRRSLFLIFQIVILSGVLVAKDKSGKDARLQFIENKGQVTDQYGTVRSDIDIKADGGTVVMFVGSGELHYQFYKKNNPIPSFPKGEGEDALFHSKESESNENSSPPLEEPEEVSTYRLDVELVGANKNAAVVFREPTGYTEHYYTATTPEEGVHVNGYRKVIYKNIWPGIDWVVYTSPGLSEGEVKAVGDTRTGTISPPSEGAGEVKYDFIIHPGGDPADIRLRYKGATELRLEAGALVAVTPYGTITEAAPYSYLQESGEKVNSSYILEGNELRFDVEAQQGALIIDPSLRWATYYGGGLGVGEHDMSVTTDIYENVFFCGRTSSTNNMATAGAYQVSLKGGLDAYLVKFDSSGKRLWATYYGNSGGNEMFRGVACDKEGAVYIGGQCDTNSRGTGLTTSGAHQTSFGGGDYDGLIVKFDSSGQRRWATLYGGAGEEYNLSVTIGRNGALYISGVTLSDSGIATSGAYMDTLSIEDGFLVKFNSSGARIWGTYFGGSGRDGFNSVVTSKNGAAVYAAGYSLNSNGVASSGAHQQAFAGGGYDGMLAGFDADDGSRLWSTYYGGTSVDYASGVQVDDDGNVYICGTTLSNNNIATNGAYKPVITTIFESFLAKFNSSGTRLWATYYPAMHLGSVFLGNDARVYIEGFVDSRSGSIATSNAHQSSFSGDTDDCLGSFSSAGLRVYGSYYGGSYREGGDYLLNNSNNYAGQCLAMSNAGRLYMGGFTRSTGGIATGGSFMDTKGTTVHVHAYLSAWDADTVVYIPQRYIDTVWCPGDTVRLGFGVNLPFGSSNEFTAELSDASGDFSNAVAIGTKSASTDDTIVCVIPYNTTAGAGYRVRITADAPARTSWDNQWDIRIKPNPNNFSASSNTPVCTGDTLKLEGATTSTGITWAWSGPNSFSSAAEDTAIAEAAMSDAGDYIIKATLNNSGCSLYDTATVIMKPTPAKPVIVDNSPVCQYLSLQLAVSSSTGGVGYSWLGPAGFSSSSAGPSISNMQSVNAGDYIGTATLNGCSSSDTATVVVNPKPAMASASAPNSPLCARQDLQLNATTVNGANYNWYGPGGYTANSQNPNRSYMQYNDSGYYYVYTEQNTCLSDTDSVKVVVNTDPFVNIFPTPGATICDGAEAIFTAVPTNGGTPTYEWFINGVSTGQTGLTYKTSNIQQGDIVTCHMTSTGTCATPFTDTSNDIPMSVTPLLTPAVSIVSNPNTTLYPNEPVSFTATPTNGGPTPQYQWRRNGQDIGGATGATWGANANFMSDGDEICVLMTSDYACPDPDTALSNCIKVDIRVSVEDITNNTDIKAYPNPVSGWLHISGIAPHTQAKLFDLTGRHMTTEAITTKQGMNINMAHLASGTYMLHLTTPGTQPHILKITKE